MNLRESPAGRIPNRPGQLAKTVLHPRAYCSNVVTLGLLKRGYLCDDQQRQPFDCQISPCLIDANRPLRHHPHRRRTGFRERTNLNLQSTCKCPSTGTETRENDVFSNTGTDITYPDTYLHNDGDRMDDYHSYPDTYPHKRGYHNAHRWLPKPLETRMDAVFGLS